MNKPIAWDTLHSFEMWPGRTFFGLDKSSSHCFTLPKKMYPSLISHFNLRKGNLQSNINFKINGNSFPAIIRLARQDRSKPIKLKAESLPKRDVVQFNWKGQYETISSIKNLFNEAYDSISEYSENKVQFAIFSHIRDSDFAVFAETHETNQFEFVRESKSVEINSRPSKLEARKEQEEELFNFDE